MLYSSHLTLFTLLCTSIEYATAHTTLLTWYRPLSDNSSKSSTFHSQQTTTCAASGPTTTTKAASTSSKEASKQTATATTAAATPTTTATASNSPASTFSIKAGIAGGDAYSYVVDHIGWWSDYTPIPSGHTGKPIPIGMCWGDGHTGATDLNRFNEFKAITDTPEFMMGFYEPDWTPPDSSDVNTSTAATIWNQYFAPMGQRGTKLLSPSMAKQKEETWLTPFKAAITYPWDYTSIHVNVNTLDKVEADVEYFLNKYQKPIWVSEFACVASSATEFQPCSNQSEIDQFINQVVPYFEQHPNITAYGYSTGDGLGTVWPLTDSKGNLQASGRTYLAAISKYH